MSSTSPYRPELLQCIDLEIGYSSTRKHPALIAGPISTGLHPGRLVCLLGPNGSGKSTLLRTLAGLQHPLAGQVRIAGMAPGRPDPSQLARKISLVLTEPVRSLNLDVYSLVALGRYPYSGWLGRLSPNDKEMVSRALEAARITQFMHRKLAELSDGETQKVMLARALAQDTPLMMLDEPTAHLDLPSRIQLMRLLHELARDTGKAILVSTHELDLALQVADEVWLMQPRTMDPHRSGSFHCGAPEDLVLDGIFEEAFDKEGIHFDKHTGSFPIYTGASRPIRLLGEGAPAFWTRRALRRIGYNVISNDAPFDDTPFDDTQASGQGSVPWTIRIRHVAEPAEKPAAEPAERNGERNGKRSAAGPGPGEKTQWHLETTGDAGSATPSRSFDSIGELLLALQSNPIIPRS